MRQDPGGVSLLAGHHLPKAASRLHQATLFLDTSVPDPPDPNVFGPPGSDPDQVVRGMDPNHSIIKQKW